MIKLISLLLILFLFGSCGDLFMDNRHEGEGPISQFVTCDLDVDAFSYILEKNIKGDIQCLQESLHLFMDMVKTDRPGFISKKVLKDFILNGPLNIDTNTVDIVDSVFDISHIVIGTDPEYIVRSDVDVLMDFLIFFNNHIWKSYKFFVADGPVNYSRHLKERNIIYNEFSLIAEKLKSIYRVQRETVDSIDTERFIFNFFKNKHITLEKIRSLMFLKRAFLGGDVWRLNHLEIADALEALPHLAQVAFDIAKVDHYEFDNGQQTFIKVFLRDVDIVSQHLFFDRNASDSVFTIYDIINAVNTLAPDLLPIDIGKYPREFMKLKEIILGDGSEQISGKEIISALDQGSFLLNQADLFYRAYNFYIDDMKSKLPISHDFSDFPVNSSLEEEYLDNFSRIAHEYKFIKGSATSSYYTFEYFRNDNAFFQTVAIEYLMKKVMAFYGRENDQARGGYHMTLDETVNIIKDFKWFLRDYGIITIGRKGGGEIQGVADNLVLMSTLFQYQSNGCDSSTVCMEVPEITEFLIGLLTAVEVKHFFTETMESLCYQELDLYHRIAPDCFRRNFLNVIETKIPGDGRSIADYMPFLHASIKEMIKELPEDSPITESEAFMKFMLETESFTRTCMYYDNEKTDEVYMKTNDAFAVFAGLLNVESTLLRFDLDQNNKVDAKNSKGKNEVLNAYYKTYKGAIIGLVKDKVGQDWIAKLLAKPIFQYLVRYGSVPDTNKFSSIWRFVRFILRSNKKSDISRTTISTMLKTIGEQSEGGKSHPFKCEECLRDPTINCVPEGEDWL